MSSALFPVAAIDAFRRSAWDKHATRKYELMSGGFMWSDEAWREVGEICVAQDNWAFRYVLGYRASLIRESPRLELRDPWTQLLEACPQWPGFRPDRCSPKLKEELDAIAQQRLAELDELG